MEAPQRTKLLDRVRQVARFRHLSRKTEKSYPYYIQDLIRFHQKRHPRATGAPEIRAYLSHLAIEKKFDTLGLRLHRATRELNGAIDRAIADRVGCDRAAIER